MGFSLGKTIFFSCPAQRLLGVRQDLPAARIDRKPNDPALGWSHILRVGSSEATEGNPLRSMWEKRYHTQNHPFSSPKIGGSFKHVLKPFPVLAGFVIVFYIVLPILPQNTNTMCHGASPRARHFCSPRHFMVAFPV